MTRGLDHLVHAVRDRDLAAEFYRRLGFVVGARNRHPWGTHNHIIQLPGFFVELLSFAEPEKLGTDGFSRLFAAYNREFAAKHEGLSMLILESANAAADAATFARTGIAVSQALHFEREGKRPDGSTVKVGFSLAFAEDIGALDIHFATCQQHYPENFWNPTYQQHANGVSAINAALLVAQDPETHLEMLLGFTGADTAASNESGYTIPLQRGQIEVMTPAAFASVHRRIGAGRNAQRALGGASLQGWLARKADRNPAASRHSIRAERGRYRDRPAAALGATLLFTSAG